MNKLLVDPLDSISISHSEYQQARKRMQTCVRKHVAWLVSTPIKIWVNQPSQVLGEITNVRNHQLDMHVGPQQIHRSWWENHESEKQTMGVTPNIDHCCTGSAPISALVCFRQDLQLSTPCGWGPSPRSGHPEMSRRSRRSRESREHNTSAVTTPLRDALTVRWQLHCWDKFNQLVWDNVQVYHHWTWNACVGTQPFRVFTPNNSWVKKRSMIIHRKQIQYEYPRNPSLSDQSLPFT